MPGHLRRRNLSRKHRPDRWRHGASNGLLLAWLLLGLICAGPAASAQKAASNQDPLAGYAHLAQAYAQAEAQGDHLAQDARVLAGLHGCDRLERGARPGGDGQPIRRCRARGCASRDRAG